MSKILVQNRPILGAYCYYASITSILQGAKDFNNWLYSNFISYRISRSNVICYGHPMSPTFLTPWTKANTFARNMIEQKWDSIIDFVIDSIEMNYYVYLKVNRKHIKAFSGYQKGNSVHELLISGYDREKREFHIADNFQQGKFVFTTCSFEEFINAYDDTKADSYGGVFLISVDLDKPYDFNLEQFKERLMEYLNPQGNIFTYNPLPMGTVYGALKNDSCGTDVYQVILKDLEERLSSHEEARLDRRMFFLLWEHKSLMLSRMDFFVEKEWISIPKDVIETLMRVEELFKIVLNLSLKYNITKEDAILKRIRGYMQDGIEKESQALNRIVEII